MTREELIEKICPSDNISDCCSGECSFGCDDCKVTVGYMLDEYDKQIRADDRAKVLEIVNGIKRECIDYFKDIDLYYNACGMKDSLEEFWDDVIESIKEQGNE